MINIDKVILEWSYRIKDGIPDLDDPYKIQKLREALRSQDCPDSFITELLQNLKEAACKPGQNPERDGCTAQSGKTGSGTKEEPDKDEKEELEKEEPKIKHSLKTDEARNKKMQEVIDLFINDDAEKVSGSGRFSLSKGDVKKYREYLNLSPEERETKLNKIIEDQRKKVGKITEGDIDNALKNLKENLGSKKFNALKASIKKKGDPPGEYTKGDRGTNRIGEVLRHYLETGGISPITGEIVPFHDSQLDHITSLDNGGVDGAENWMWMESRFNQFKGRLTDPEVEAKLIEQGLMTANEINKDMKEKDLDNWKDAAEVAYYETKFQKGDFGNMSQAKLDNMNADELNNFVKGWNNYVGEGDDRYVPRYGTRKITIAGSEKPLEVSRGGAIKPDKNNPDSWGITRNEDGSLTKPDLKDDPEGFEKASAAYEKSRASGGKKIKVGDVREEIKRILEDDIPDKNEENVVDEAFKSIQKEKQRRKEEIKALNDRIKENPKSSEAAKKAISQSLKGSGIPDEIKKAIGSGSSKKPQDQEAYKKALEKKQEFLLDKWHEWEDRLATSGK